jgi:hypothetical protein
MYRNTEYVFFMDIDTGLPGTEGQASAGDVFVDEIKWKIS